MRGDQVPKRRTTKKESVLSTVRCTFETRQTIRLSDTSTILQESRMDYKTMILQVIPASRLRKRESLVAGRLNTIRL